MPARPRRRAHRPADLTGDNLTARQEAYAEWSKSARERGRQVAHNEDCSCKTCSQPVVE